MRHRDGRCVQSEPYLREIGEPGLIGNDRFEGYCVELAEKICSEYLHVGYEIRLVADGKYGEKMPNGTWNGMVGELTNRVGISVISVRLMERHTLRNLVPETCTDARDQSRAV